ncbi:MAG: hypothetical protein LUD47_03885 [Clostridia bacterium]|nr:hypothetical protein [Clostridia bacterium]
MNTKPKKCPLDKNFSAAIKGHAYGSAAKAVYSKFCDSLGWDADRTGCFGQQKNLFADNADTDRTKDVWFLCHYNFDFDASKIDRKGTSTNTIKEGGRFIYEEVKGDRDEARSDRIVFVKDGGLYVFYGVYRYNGFDDGNRRTFERYSDVYPLPEQVPADGEVS